MVSAGCVKQGVPKIDPIGATKITECDDTPRGTPKKGTLIPLSDARNGTGKTAPCNTHAVAADTPVNMVRLTRAAVDRDTPVTARSISVIVGGLPLRLM